MMQVTIVSDVPVSPNYALRKEEEVSAYPHIIRLVGGELMCVYRQGTAKHSMDGVLVAQKSADNGKTWSDQVILFDGREKPVPEAVMTGTHCQLPDGQVIAVFRVVEVENPDVYVFSEAGRKLRHHLYLIRSDDFGEKWSAPETVQIPGTAYSLYTGTRPVVLANNDLLLPMEATGSRGQQLTLSAISRDRGKTFLPAVINAEDPTGRLSYGDSKITILPDGRLFMLNWTFTRDTETTVSVHSCISPDNGRSWSEPKSIDLLCQILVPLMLPSNLMIAAGNVRSALPGIYLWVSRDFGGSWNSEPPVLLWNALTQRVDGTAVPSSRNAAGPDGSTEIWDALPGYTFGTPDLVNLEDGSILLTYYAMIDGLTHIRACRFTVKDTP